ncbi:hypothetical protein R5R35_013600 [Gryllus longicercus]|uniref:Lipase domain-containing protein n=1 Tax=Gryllus longicercus TaxID=2509291 RepID=A0AAN9VDG7_9ORTH
MGTGIMLQTVLSMLATNMQLLPIHPNEVYDLNSTTRCFNKYGCFSIEPPWKSGARPISLLPESPKKISPNFCLYTRKNRFVCERLVEGDDKTILGSTLSPSNPLVLISHGYLENGNKTWMLNMMVELLQFADLNVILIDWGGGSAPPYSQAVANTRVVGTVAAHLVNQIGKLGYRTTDCHVIGHSLGSHIASYIGQVLKDKFKIRLARISALDPAEPHFTKTPPIMRLDPTDADFIDVTHTDTAPFISGGLGLLEPVGHVDFYPNGGVNQPGCSETMSHYIGRERGSFVGGLQKFLSCNHIRSYKYYTESINTRCPYMAIACESWEHFKNGSCFKCASEITPESHRRGERLCATFGYHSLSHLNQQWNGKSLSLSQEKLYLMTGSRTPFCQEHYKVGLHISGLPHSVKHGAEIGMFWVTLLGDKGTSHRMGFTTSEQLYEPGSVHQTVIASRGVGAIQSVIVEWEYRMSFLNPLSWRVMGIPKIYLDWITITNLETGNEFKTCQREGKPILSTEPLLMAHNPICNITIPPTVTTVHKTQFH